MQNARFLYHQGGSEERPNSVQRSGTSWASESGSMTRGQGDSDDRFRTQGRHQPPTPGRLCCGEGLGGESSQAHGSEGQAAGTGGGQRALPWTRPAYISSLPFLLSLLLGDTEFWGAGVEQLHTQPAVNGDRKTTQLLRERCPKAHLGRLGGDTREKRHEQVPLVCRARKMK